MPFNTALTHLLGLRHPIVLAPMGGVSGGALAAAVGAAGGFGLIGPSYLDEAWIEREFDIAGDTAIGIGFITWHMAKHPQRLDAALARRPRAVMLSFGDAKPFVGKIKNAGAKVILQVQTLAGAIEAKRLGADIIVAQGTEAGGHGAARALFGFLPAAVDAAAPVPVLAAGAVVDGRGLAAALAMGAAGALVGTRFFAATESLGHANAKARIVAGNGDATVRTRVVDIARGLDWPAPFTGRALINDFTTAWHGREDQLEAVREAELARYSAAAARGDFSTAIVYAGEGIDLIDDIAPAAAIVERMVAEAEAALARLITLRTRTLPV
ncbi:MAG: nitronate monooxygenase [Rhodospirillales bacterium]|nr:nitronate monooxygenase [Rhodospirillales bacterium]